MFVDELKIYTSVQKEDHWKATSVQQNRFSLRIILSMFCQLKGKPPMFLEKDYNDIAAFAVHRLEEKKTFIHTRCVPNQVFEQNFVFQWSYCYGGVMNEGHTQHPQKLNVWPGIIGNQPHN